jgi:hypothetical protein
MGALQTEAYPKTVFRASEPRATGRATGHGPRASLEEINDKMARLQVLPYSSGAPSTYLPFTLPEFAKEATPLYAETPASGHVIDEASLVAGNSETYDRLRADALSPQVSPALIHKLMMGLPDE